MRRHSLRSKFPHIFGGWHKMTAGKRLHTERFFQYSVLFRWQNGGQRIAAEWPQKSARRPSDVRLL